MSEVDLLREMIRSEFVHLGAQQEAACDLALERHNTVMAHVTEIRSDVKEVKAEGNRNTLTITKQAGEIRAINAKVGSTVRMWTLVISAFTAGGIALAWILMITGVIKTR